MSPRALPRIALVFGLGLFLLLGAGLMTLYSIHALIAEGAEVERALRALRAIRNLLSDVQDIETGARGFVITGDDRFLEAYHAGIRELPVQVNAVRKLLEERPERVKYLEMVEALIDDKVTLSQRQIELRRTAGRDAAVAEVSLGQERAAMDVIRVAMRTMEIHEEDRLANHRNLSQIGAERTAIVAGAATVLACALIALAGILLYRESRNRTRAEQAVRDSELLIRSSVDAMSVCVALLDETGNIITVNKVWRETLEFLGRKKDAPTEGLPYAETAAALLGGGEWATRFDEAMRRVIEGKNERFAMEYSLATPEGERWHIAGVARFHRHGQVRLVVTHEDISERKEALLVFQRALHEAREGRERLNAMLKAVAAGVVVTDTENRLVLTNKIAESLLQLDPKDAQGRAIEDAVRDTTLREKINATLRQRTTGAKFDFTVDGRVLCARTSLFEDGRGAPAGIITVIEDVTREREVDRMKTEFLSTAAHELRTPLTSIRGFSEILLTRVLPTERQRQFLKTIQDQSEALATLINDLLDLARIESGRGMSLKRSTTDLSVLAADVVAAFSNRGGLHEFSVESTDGQEPLVHCDPDKIQQVFRNLLSNAVKYSPEGGMIHIRVEAGFSEVECEISDEGIGMSPEHLARVFEKFYRVDTSNTAVEGTGLGMSITKAIVEQHGGSIRVESELGRGTRVLFSLPKVITAGMSGPYKGTTAP